MEPHLTFSDLIASRVSLERLSAAHREPLRAAADDPRIWQHTTQNGQGTGFADWFELALHGPNQATYAVIDRPSGAILGSTRFYDIAWPHRRLQLGYTWYIPSVWGSAINPSCKELLLNHAFGLGFRRVGFSVDVENVRSQRAIEKLGAIREGVLRNHMVVQHGRTRDTVVYSILPEEWYSRGD